MLHSGAQALLIPERPAGAGSQIGFVLESGDDLGCLLRFRHHGPVTSNTPELSRPCKEREL